MSDGNQCLNEGYDELLILNGRSEAIVADLPKAAIVMKVGPHSNMSLSEIIESKKIEEGVYGVHFWGYSGSFCQPTPAQAFCKWAKEKYGEDPSLILIETKSSYTSLIGCISLYSIDNKSFVPFKAPVQLQGARFSFVAKDLHPTNAFCPALYSVHGGKNEGKPLLSHLRYRINKSFATLVDTPQVENCVDFVPALIATLVEPYAIWLKE